MTLKTSLLITGDSSVAQKAVDDLARAVERTGAAGKTAAAGLAQQATAEREAAAAARTMAAAQAEATAEFQQLATAAATTGGALATVAGGASGSAAAVRDSTGQLRDNSRAANDNAAAAQRHAAGVRNLGQQFGDLAVMIQGGIDPARAFATQAAQMGYAMSEMGGKAGAVGRFLVGPWGIALTVATAALAPLVQSLLEGGSAADEQREALAQAATAADSFGNAQSLLGKVVDLTTGKLRTQNTVLIRAIELQAQAGVLKAKQDAADARAALGTVAKPSTAEQFGSAMRDIGSALAQPGQDGGRRAQRAQAADLAPLRTILAEVAALSRDPRTSPAALADAAVAASRRVDALGTSGVRTADKLAAANAQLLKLGTAANDYIAFSAAGDVTRGGKVPDFLKPYERPDKARVTKPKSTDARDEFGRDAADRVAALTAQFDDTPPMVRQVEQAKRQLTDLIDDLNRRQPPGFEKLIADAEAARPAIEAGINRPLDDFLDGQREQLRQGDLILQGRSLEEEAQRAIVAIERQRGPLAADQRAQVLASVVALQAQERQLERIHAVQQINLGALQDMRAIVTQTIYEGPQSLAELPGRVFESFKRFSAEKIAEEWFGEMFRDARDKVTGAGKVDQSANVIVGAFDRVAASAETLSGALAGAAGRPAGSVTPGMSDAALIATIGASAREAIGALPGLAANGSVQDDTITVVARARSEIYGDTIANVLKRAGIGKDTASDIGKGAGKALAGAFEGQGAAGVAGMLGMKASGSGAAIGGAVGSFLPIPGGSIVGGLAGGLLGGLFAGPKAYGTATLTGSGNARTGGNRDGAEVAARGLGGQVQEGLARIAEQLGGQLGSYLVSIGTYDGDYRVSTSGQSGEMSFGKKNKSKSTLVDFSDDQGAAIAFAIGDAIKDGAVTGLSAAVTKAIQSSTDINKALAEALKVQDVELLLGGPLAQYQKAFRDLEATAKERVRVAQQYGFDVLAIEKRNAEDRAKLAEELTRAQAGALKSLVEEMTSGSLFEGTAMDRIAALNTAIAKAKADMDAGVEGAADTLASLYQQRLAASKEAYGTTGAYAADRAATIAEAQAAIARVNAQVVAAQAGKTSDPALATTNAALDENNDQNAEMIAALREQNALLTRLLAGGAGSSVDLSRLAAV